MKTRDTRETLDTESAPFAAEDYVQMACQLRRSAELSIRYPDGTSGGVIVNKGELWHAWDNLGQGSEAFLRMVGRARVTRIRNLLPAEAHTRTIWESCQKHLLQAVILQDATSASRELHDEEAEAVTTRSHTERPVELSVAPVGMPRSITTFLRQPVVIQRAAAAVFGVTLIGSVGQIVASPAGGIEGPVNATEPAGATRPIGGRAPTAANLDHAHEAASSSARVGAGRRSAGDVVVSVSALETIDSLPAAVPIRVSTALECTMAEAVKASDVSRTCE